MFFRDWREVECRHACDEKYFIGMQIIILHVEKV